MDLLRQPVTSDGDDARLLGYVRNDVPGSPQDRGQFVIFGYKTGLVRPGD